MSRSYKKAIVKYAGDMKLKKQYNRSIRHTDEIPNGNHYRKMNDQYDLYDVRVINLTGEPSKYWGTTAVKKTNPRSLNKIRK